MDTQTNSAYLQVMQIARVQLDVIKSFLLSVFHALDCNPEALSNNICSIIGPLKIQQETTYMAKFKLSYQPLSLLNLHQYFTNISNFV